MSSEYQFPVEEFIHSILEDDNHKPIRPTNPAEITLPAVLLAPCTIHKESLSLFCISCIKEICHLCVVELHFGHHIIFLDDAFHKANLVRSGLYIEATSAVTALNRAYEEIAERHALVKKNTSKAIDHIEQFITSCRDAIQQRKEALYASLYDTLTTKTSNLHRQLQNIEHVKNQMIQTTKTLQESSGNPTKQLSNNELALKDLALFRSIDLLPREDDNVVFQSDEDLIWMIRNGGTIEAKTVGCRRDLPPALGPQDLPTDCEIFRMFNDDPRIVAPFHRIAVNFANELEDDPGYSSTADTISEYARTPELISPEPTYESRSFVSEEVNHSEEESENLDDTLVAEKKPCEVFGTKGTKDGQFQRPWGVCCSKSGEIFVADRGNHRIQVFDQSANFIFSFGSEGNDEGEFRDPTGLTINSKNELIVSDYNNHRIQVFTLKGAFIREFGARGSKNGQFKYPWGVTSNKFNEIFVTDAQNCRIQCFTSEGRFMRAFYYRTKGSALRGLCSMPSGDVLVTDYNNHRVVVVDKSFRSCKSISDLAIKSPFFGPQGVVYDEKTKNILLADSNNHRILILDEQGTTVWCKGQRGIAVGEMDRPSGICAGPDGTIIVVDFGNSRVKIFKR